MKEKFKLSVSYHGTSDIGLERTENQDSFGKFPLDSEDPYQPKGLLYIIADGMGGHAGGKKASRLALNVVSQVYFSLSSNNISDCLQGAFNSANSKIYQTSEEELQFKGMGTTCTALVLEKDFAYIAHVGDSRVYRITHEKIVQLTQDHTQVAEMYRQGILSKKEAKHHPSKSVLIRALGTEPKVEIDIKEKIQVKPEDYYVLCSDGLANVKKEEIREIVLANSPEDAGEELISLANQRGGHDNVTVLIIKINKDKEDSLNAVEQRVKNPLEGWFKLGILAIAIFTILLIGFTYRQTISGWFGGNDNKEVQAYNPDDRKNQNKEMELLLSKAGHFLEVGIPDSALIIYYMILKNNPMHLGALDGINVIADEYKKQGDQLKNENNYGEAILFYEKAAGLQPDDKTLISLIELCEREILKSDFPSSIDYTSKTKNAFEDSSVDLSKDKNSDIAGENIFISDNGYNEWNLIGLSEEDYEFEQNGIIFLRSGKIKKAIYEKSQKDVDVEVNVQLNTGRQEKRAGIIIGYNSNNEIGTEDYFLFSTNNMGNFLLQKISDGQEKKLLSVSRQIYSSNDSKIIKLKIKSLGPWIMIYNDQKLLDSWLSKEFITGKIGLYADPNINVEFSYFNVSSAFESKIKD
ncbi:MAG: Stp1/IreP family PP2C-type Ser/Thr phosphatase [Bacteroidetes bacterium]|nr:Stp1/IreP family PP2C-type Ser/Thr phosphatase [Bacteroidota bacterium]